MRKLLSTFVAAIVVISASVSHAGSITVNNFSFENPALANDTYQGDGIGSDGTFPLPTNVIPGWTIDAGGIDGVQNFIGSSTSFGNGATLPAPADGKQGAYINGNYIYQDVGALQAHTTYTLTVAVGNQTGFGAGTVGAIELLNGTDQTGAVLASTTIGTLANPIPLGSFTDYSATFTSGNSVLGDLTILLAKTSGGGQIVFDNVQLVAAPEPSSILALVGLCGMGLVIAIRRRRKA